MSNTAQEAPASFPVTTGLSLQGMTIEKDLGLAFGLVVRSMGFVKSIGAGFKTLRQGEVTQYTELLEDSRRHAVDRLPTRSWRCASTPPRSASSSPRSSPTAAR
jgi:Putative heavy-metal-binding